MPPETPQSPRRAREMSNPIKDWLGSRAPLDATGKSPELFQEFRAWCSEQGVPEALRPCQAAFGVALYKAGVVRTPQPRIYDDRRRKAG